MSLTSYSSSNSFQTGDLHHIVLSIAGTTHTLYLDGVQVAQNISGGNIFAYTSNIKKPIIGASRALMNAFNGSITDARVYNYAINAINVSDLYLDRNLIVYYPFDTVINQTTNNYATLNYDATFIEKSFIAYNNKSLVGNGALSLINTAFGSSSNYVLSLPTINSIPIKTNANTGLTVSCWVNATCISNNIMRIFDICVNEETNGIAIDILGTNVLSSSYQTMYNYYVLQNSIYGTINFISMNDFGYLVMATNTGIFYSFDFGISWNKSNAPTATWVSISLVNIGSGYALACTNSAIYYSINGGINWIMSGAPTSGYTYIAVYLSSSGNAIVITSSSYVLYSSGYFDTWNISDTGILPYSVGLASNGTGIVGGNDSVAITNNNGITWTIISNESTGLLPRGFGSNISDNGNYIVSSDKNTEYTYYSLDQGLNWLTEDYIYNHTGSTAVGNNGIVFNNDIAGSIIQINLLTHTIYPTEYIINSANIAISPNGTFVAFIIANDDTSKKIIIKTN